MALLPRLRLRAGRSRSCSAGRDYVMWRERPRHSRLGGTHRSQVSSVGGKDSVGVAGFDGVEPAPCAAVAFGRLDDLRKIRPVRVQRPCQLGDDDAVATRTVQLAGMRTKT